MAGVVGVIWGNREANYFRDEDWTKPCVICPASNAIGSSVLAKEAYAARGAAAPCHGITWRAAARRRRVDRAGRQAPLAKYIQDAFKNLKADI
jgi:hypothetical protein